MSQVKIAKHNLICAGKTYLAIQSTESNFIFHLYREERKMSSIAGTCGLIFNVLG